MSNLMLKIVLIILYIAKQYALQIYSLLLGKIFRKGQLEKIRRFVKFVVFCYIPWWLTAPIPSSAPKNDQLLMNSFLHYKNVDEVIANEPYCVLEPTCGILQRS